MYYSTVILKVGSRLVRVETYAVTVCCYIFAAFLCLEFILPYVATYLWLYKIVFPNYTTWCSVVFFYITTDKRYGPLEET